MSTLSCPKCGCTTFEARRSFHGSVRVLVDKSMVSELENPRSATHRDGELIPPFICVACDFEVESTENQEAPPELIIKLHNGNSLCFATEEQTRGWGYIRVCNPQGIELGKWLSSQIQPEHAPYEQPYYSEEVLAKAFVTALGLKQ